MTTIWDSITIGSMGLPQRRNDLALIGVNLVLLALAIFVAWGRLGPYAFTSLTTPRALHVQGWFVETMPPLLDLSCN
jgi:hypothetical protein